MPRRMMRPRNPRFTRISPREADAVPLLNFFLIGLGGAVAGLVTFGTVWRGRFRSVRRALVRGELQRGER